MHTIALFGSGTIGEAITALLTSSGSYSVRVCDGDIERARRIASQWSHCEAFPLNVNDEVATEKLLDGCTAVISALPFHCNPTIARYAANRKVHYLDLTEDIESTRFISSLASSAKNFFIPQCGLAPGFVSLAANHLVKTFESVNTVKMRVGALPVYPTNRLKYNLAWSTEGLINEYCNLCEVIENGKALSVLPLEGYEHFSLNGDDYEAFNTSGGLGSLCLTLQGKVRELNYKTIRYPGHRDLIAFLLHDLRFLDDRGALKDILERSISTTAQDKCLILVEVTGVSAGRLTQRTYASTVYNQKIEGHQFSAIQVTTAAGICGILDLMLEGHLGERTGIVRPEEISLTSFLENRFGKYYRDELALSGLT